MEKKDYSELMDCLKNVNMGLMCLLRVNWKSHPEARGFYYKFEKLYDELRHWAYEGERRLPNSSGDRER